MKAIEFNDNYKEILFTIPLFRDLDAQTQRQLIQELQFSLFEVESHQVVAEQGDTCRRLYVLLKGELEAHITDTNGNEVVLENIVAPRAFATPHLFKDDNRFPATFKAVKESVLLTATKDSTFRLLSKCPNVLKNFFCVSGNCNQCTTMRLDILSRKTIRERILVYLFKKVEKGSHTLKMGHTLTQLAEYLNVTRPALSTEFNKMEKEELISRTPDGNIELNLSKLKKPV